MNVMQISLNVWALYNKLEEAELKRIKGNMFVYRKDEECNTKAYVRSYTRPLLIKRSTKREIFVCQVYKFL
jgi:hypothetical protein